MARAHHGDRGRWKPGRHFRAPLHHGRPHQRRDRIGGDSQPHQLFGLSPRRQKHHGTRPVGRGAHGRDRWFGRTGFARGLRGGRHGARPQIAARPHRGARHVLPPLHYGAGGRSYHCDHSDGAGDGRTSSRFGPGRTSRRLVHPHASVRSLHDALLSADSPQSCAQHRGRDGKSRCPKKRRAKRRRRPWARRNW